MTFTPVSPVCVTTTPRLNSAVVAQTGKKKVSANWEPVSALLADGDWMRGSELRDLLGITANSAEAKALTRELAYWSTGNGPLEKSGPRSAPKYRLVPVPDPDAEPPLLSYT